MAQSIGEDAEFPLLLQRQPVGKPFLQIIAPGSKSPCSVAKHDRNTVPYDVGNPVSIHVPDRNTQSGSGMVGLRPASSQVGCLIGENDPEEHSRISHPVATDILADT